MLPSEPFRLGTAQTVYFEQKMPDVFILHQLRGFARHFSSDLFSGGKLDISHTGGRGFCRI